ncbi:MAG: RDD family protein [Boseongicola sp.]|nr:MAG: RDD family protein [Boseongicola sp.]
MTLPHPETHPDFYEDVVSKRFMAWLVDVVIISALTAILTVFTLFTALFFLPFFYAVVSFLYRWIGLSRHSATLGMRLFSLEFRRDDGSKFDGSTAFMQVAGYFVSLAIFPLQLVSIVMMLMSERRQGLTDMVLNTVMLNKRAR